MIAWRDLRGLRDPDRFDAWLHRLVVHECIDHDCALTQDWTGACPWWEQQNPGIPMVPTFGAFDEKNYWLFSGVAGDELVRVYVLEAPAGGNVVIVANAPNAEQWAAIEGDIASIIAGIQFDTGS